MPCNSDHLNASSREIELSRVCCLLDELKGKKTINTSHWDGYHPKIYCETLSKEEEDALVARLCSKLQKVDVTKYSLEMQLWWRDHQRADKQRLRKEQAALKDAAARKAALEKLSPYERKLLGL